MTKLAEVVTLYETNPSDIVSMLREIADDIEEHNDTQAIVCIRSTDEGIIPYLWGRANTADALLLMELAKQSMISQYRLEDD